MWQNRDLHDSNERAEKSRRLVDVRAKEHSIVDIERIKDDIAQERGSRSHDAEKFEQCADEAGFYQGRKSGSPVEKKNAFRVEYRRCFRVKITTC
jgi:hypothetical protein